MVSEKFDPSPSVSGPHCEKKDVGETASTRKVRAYSGSRMGGQSTKACANTGRSLSGAGTGCMRR